MMDAPKEWEKTQGEWDELVEGFERIAEAIRTMGKQIVDSFAELYKNMEKSLTGINPQLGKIRRDFEKYLRQQSIKDKRKQLERRRKRQQLAAANMDKSNNWRRLHGLHARRKKN